MKKLETSARNKIFSFSEFTFVCSCRCYPSAASGKQEVALERRLSPSSQQSLLTAAGGKQEAALERQLFY
jgi:hypothetical protein